MNKKPVIIVTDGDETAFRAIEEASEALHLYPLKASKGNPTPLSGRSLVEAVENAPGDPVVVMVDDRGDAKTGPGEHDLDTLMQADSLEVLGVVAVAANTHPVSGVHVDSSVSRKGTLIRHRAVDKTGNPTAGDVLYGDTVDVLDDDEGQLPIVGLGDPGKMGGQDQIGRGAPATRRALQEILEQSGYHSPGLSNK